MPSLQDVDPLELDALELELDALELEPVAVAVAWIVRVPGVRRGAASRQFTSGKR